MTDGLIAPWLSDSRWPTKPIRYVARLGTGHTPSRNVPQYWKDCTIPWITLADVWQLRNGTADTITKTKEKISNLGLANSSAVKHPAGTVILSRTASVGFSAIMGVDMATTQDFATWTCGPDLEPKYLLHALRAMAPDLKRVAAGSTHKTVYMPDIEQLRIPLPPLGEQRRIADYLDTETTRINKLTALQLDIRNKLSERERALRDGLVDNLAALCGELPMRRFVTKIEQGASPQCEAIPRQAADEWGVLKLSAVKQGRFDDRENKRLPEDVAPTPAYEVHRGDLLVTRANTPHLVGDVAVITGNTKRLLLPDLIYRVGLLPEMDAAFVAQVALSSRVRLLVESVARGSSQSMVKLRGEDIKEWPIPVASATQQRTLLTEVERNAETIGRLRAVADRQLSLLDERRQALITAAVTGQFDVTTARQVTPA
ncbi:restriction endonuclease subunit S [Streptomyces flavotricini]|uniref:Restriction endonuclease subunit S n=1 Tax=Streptomyces flavotricini TaxID=66888 RepID=A0ABS8E296_9ACTN|nr:restriction endonuclease subunit S [Streptomyces flavotricini]MCC0094717.1 restriction endonuclease subunit S [Streptomyces flavotricini]